MIGKIFVYDVKEFVCLGQNLTPTVVYFDKLSGAARTRKLVETLFSAVFNHVCLKKG